MIPIRLKSLLIPGNSLCAGCRNMRAPARGTGEGTHYVLNISSAMLCAPGSGNLAGFAQVEFAGAQVGQGVEVEELVGARFPEVRQVALGQLLQAWLQLVGGQLVQDDQTLAFLLVRHAGHHKGLLGRAGLANESPSSWKLGHRCLMTPAVANSFRASGI